MRATTWVLLHLFSCISCSQLSQSLGGSLAVPGCLESAGRTLEQHKLAGFVHVLVPSTSPGRVRACRRSHVTSISNKRVVVLGNDRAMELRMAERMEGNDADPSDLDKPDPRDASVLNQYATYDEEGGNTDSGDGGAFSLPTKKSGAGWLIGRAAPAPVLEMEDMTEELKERVLAVMIDAFDNLPPFEVERKLDILWSQGPDAGPNDSSLRYLVALTEEVEGIAKASRDRWNTPGADFEDLRVALQTARSRVRMYGKDAEYYDPDSFMSWMNPDLTPRTQPVDEVQFKWPWQRD